MTDIDTEVASIAARKSGVVFTADKSEKQKATLTPVGTERPSTRGIPDVPEVFLTNEAVTDVARDLRRQAQLLLDVADALDLHTGEVTQPTPNAQSWQAEKQAEREADARAAANPHPETFGDRQLRISAEAKAATFKGDYTPAAREVFADMLADAPSASAKPDWKCPVHGDSNIEVLTGKRTQRVYRACKTCNQFEK